LIGIVKADLPVSLHIGQALLTLLSTGRMQQGVVKTEEFFKICRLK